MYACSVVCICAVVYVCTLAVHMYTEPPCWAVTPLGWVVYACTLGRCSAMYVCTLAVHMYTEPPCWAVTPPIVLAVHMYTGRTEQLGRDTKKPPFRGARL